uniref:Uncharacterized protein n=1 Tax=Rhipicephalus zambeziensis TaxID=60191 RepID=A0A224YHC6_9ACAR
MPASLFSASAAFIAPARALLPAGRKYDAQGALINLDFIRDMTATAKATAKTRRDCPHNCYRSKNESLPRTYTSCAYLKQLCEME